MRFLGLLVLLSMRPPSASDAQPAPRPAFLDALAARIAFEQEDRGLRAVSLVVVDGGRVVWAEGFGYADAAGRVPATAATVYRAGSLSKLVTAMAVMQLVEAGRLDLDAPVAAYLPGFHPPGAPGDGVTLRHLLAHRAGLVREPPVGHYFDPAAPPLADVVARLGDVPLVFVPGTRTKYSNAGYAVAGRVVEHVAGADFATHAERSLLAPMGMTGSSFRPRPDLAPHLAAGQMETYDGRTFEAPTFEPGILPAANLYTSALDLGRFLQILLAGGQAPGGPVLQPETLEAMWTVQPGGDAGSGFGLGFVVDRFEGTRRIGHSGAMYGFTSRLSVLPERGLGVAVLASLDAAHAVVDGIADHALALLLARQDGRPLPGFERPGPVDPALARALAGHYGGPRPFAVEARAGEVFVHDGPLHARLRQRGEALVTDDRLGRSVRIVLRGDTLYLDGEAFRREAAVPPPPPSDEQAEAIGIYGWDHNPLYVLERAGQLHALVEWFFEYPLRRVEADRYVFPDSGLYAGEPFTLERDPAGKVLAAWVGPVRFERRALAPEEGNVFRIVPVRPVEALREEALAAEPPREDGPFLAPDLVELHTVEPGLRYDLRYATERNFMGAVFYRVPRAFLQRPAAGAVARAHRALRAHGLGLIVYDAYRPWYVTRMFWDATPEHLKDFVADPSKGSRHNRGAAVDVGLYELATGAVVEMPSGYDEFTERAYAAYPGGSGRARYHRELLRAVMERHGFEVYPYEWWHFDYTGWRAYPLLNLTFDAIR